MEKRQPDKFGLKLLKFLFAPFTRKPKLTFKEDISGLDNAIIIANHNYAKGAVYLCAHFPYDHVIWGNAQFCTTRKEARDKIKLYMKEEGKPRILYPFAGLVAGFVRFVFKVSPIIPVYYDMRMYQTIQESIKQYENKKNIIIFVDDLKDTFSTEIKNIQSGFLILMRALQQKGEDPYLICAASDKSWKNIVFDKPLKLSALDKTFKTDEEILDYCQNTINNMF